MKKSLLIFVAAMLLNVTSAMAQDKRVAVFEPAGSVEHSIKEIVLEEINSIIANVGGYIVAERQMMNAVFEEQQLPLSGSEDDTLNSQLGKMMGTHYVLVTKISTIENNLHVAFRMLNVKTAEIEQQRIIRISELSELISAIQKPITEVFSSSSKDSQQSDSVTE
ncbi:MAG: hypothetical protein FWF09_03760 [Bacteroidales bacterium]|nr:hypothetical protein [Bacteroidales bacterium]